MGRQKGDSRRRGQPSPGAPTDPVFNDPNYIWYDPNKGKRYGEKLSSYKARWVTLKDFNRLTRDRRHSAQARLYGRVKSRKRRYTPKGHAFKELTRLVFKLCTLLRTPQRRGGVSPIYHEPEQSISYFWQTIDALAIGKHIWYQCDRTKMGIVYAHARHPAWPKVEKAIYKIETLIRDWGLHRFYSVWTLWLNEGAEIKAVIKDIDSRFWHERIQELIDALPPTPDVSDEYKYMQLTEKE